MTRIKMILAAVCIIAGLNAVNAANATKTANRGNYFTFSQMTAPETTEVIEAQQYDSHVFQVKVASINTNVIVRIEGSVDGTNFFNLNTSEENTTITADGTYAFRSTAKIRRIRLVWVSEAGGVTATLDVSYFGGAQ